jgi:hypothetical protein
MKIGECLAVKKADRGFAMETQAEIEAYDKKKTAYHEAGHVVAQHLLGGRCIRAYVWQNKDASEHEKSWLGQCTAGGSLPSKSVAIIGLSGVVAEMILERKQGDCFADAFEAIEWLDFNIIEPSPTDWQMLARMFGRETFGHEDWLDLMEPKRSAKKRLEIVEASIGLLDANWPLVERVALHLIEHDVMTDWDLSMLVKKGHAAI